MISDRALAGAIRGGLVDLNTGGASVEGRSMAPAFVPGERPPISTTVALPLRAGHSYVYVRDAMLILHRFVCMDGGRAVFIGDNALAYDLVPVDQVLGTCPRPAHSLSQWLIAGVNYVLHRCGRDRDARGVPAGMRLRRVLVRILRGGYKR